MTVSPRNRDFIAGFQSGSYESVKQVCDWHYSSLIEFAQQLSVNNWVAHAIVLDSLVKLVQMRDQFDNETNIKAFLYITVRNRCQPVMQTGQVVEKDDFKPGKAQEIEELSEVITALPGKCRKVLEAVYGKRLRVQEVAEQLEMELAMVGQLRERALRTLSEHLSVPIIIYYLAIVCPAHTF